MSQKQKAKNKAEAQEKVAIRFTAIGWEDYLHWQKADPAIARAINQLLRECQRTPFAGTGKPEPLTGPLTGFWSRRIDREHRLVYLAQEGAITVLACRYHYSK